MYGVIVTHESLDGGDSVVVTNEAEVEKLLLRDVPTVDQPRFRSELAAAAPYESRPETRARLHLAMLYLADGDLGRLVDARKLADQDWRDLLMQAEYREASSTGPDPRDGIAAWRKRPRRD